MDDLILKYDFGHSTPVIGIDLAIKSNIKKIYFFHFDPEYDDKKIYELYHGMLERIRGRYPNSKLEIFISNEGDEIVL